MMIPTPVAKGTMADTTTFMGDSVPAMRTSCKNCLQSCSFTSRVVNGCGESVLSGATYMNPLSIVLPSLTSTMIGKGVRAVSAGGTRRKEGGGGLRSSETLCPLFMPRKPFELSAGRWGKRISWGDGAKG